MFKSKMRLLGVSALVGAGLVVAGPATSANVQLGDWDVQIDNTVSVGVSMIMKDPDTQFLPISNGGSDFCKFSSACLRGWPLHGFLEQEIRPMPTA